MKMSGLGVSIKRPHIEEEQRNPSSNPTAAHQAAQPEEDYIFNERDLNYYWQEYAGRMPKEQVAIAKRMQNMRITLINDTTFEAVVDNEIVAKEFTGMIPTLQKLPTYPAKEPQSHHDCPD
jgi:DNA polymerase III, tau subunit (EC 2.7.7.7)